MESSTQSEATDSGQLSSSTSPSTPCSLPLQWSMNTHRGLSLPGSPLLSSIRLSLKVRLWSRVSLQLGMFCSLEVQHARLLCRPCNTWRKFSYMLLQLQALTLLFYLSPGGLVQTCWLMRCWKMCVAAGCVGASNPLMSVSLQLACLCPHPRFRVRWKLTNVICTSKTASCTVFWPSYVKETPFCRQMAKETNLSLTTIDYFHSTLFC